MKHIILMLLIANVANAESIPDKAIRNTGDYADSIPGSVGNIVTDRMYGGHTATLGDPKEIAYSVQGYARASASSLARDTTKQVLKEILHGVGKLAKPSPEGEE